MKQSPYLGAACSALFLSAPIAPAQDYYIQNVHSGKFLDVANGASANGTNVQQWSFNGSTAQRFDLVSRGGGAYSILPLCASGSQALDVWGFDTADGTNIATYSYWGGDSQQFTLRNNGDGTYGILTKVTGGSSGLDVYGWDTGNGGNVNQWSYWGGAVQRWRLHPTNMNPTGWDSRGLGRLGQTKVIYDTIVVGSGEVYDGQGETIEARGMGDGSQDENQKPIFRLMNGAILKNVIIGAPGCDGVHSYGDATVDNVWWADVGEDAFTVKDEGTVHILNSTMFYASDKNIQVNAPSTVFLHNVYAADMGKLIRQNGGSTFATTWYLDTVYVNDVSDSICRSDSPNCRVYYRNLRASNVSRWWRLRTSASTF